MFAHTDEDWRKRRSAISPAFYKGKLVNMINLAKGAMTGTLERWMSLVDKKPN